MIDIFESEPVSITLSVKTSILTPLNDGTGAAGDIALTTVVKALYKTRFEILKFMISPFILLLI